MIRRMSARDIVSCFIWIVFPLLLSTTIPASTPATHLAGQQVIVGISEYPLSDEWLDILRNYTVSGVIFLSPNYQHAAHVQATISRIKQHTQHPLFFCIDQEGGRVQRLKSGVTPVPSAHHLATTHTPIAIYSLYRQQAIDLKQWGINVNFAPVADVSQHPHNTVIGSRSYSNDPELVRFFASIAISAYTREGLFSVTKHFPGHGQPHTDSHVSLPIHSNPTGFYTTDLYPFKHLIAAQYPPAMMVSHVLYPHIDAHFPASLSPAIVSNLLKKNLAFDGLVISDDLGMGAVTNTYTLLVAALQSLRAGVEQLIVTGSPQDIHSLILNMATELSQNAPLRDRCLKNSKKVQQVKKKWF